jgi:Rad3-related DNA helicase
VKITRCGKIYLEVNEMKTMNLKALEEIFEKNLSDEYLPKALTKLISYEIAKTTQELQELRSELKVYEERFNMSSEEFFQKFNNGELGDSADFFEWATLYKMYMRASERLNLLQ